MSLESVEFVSKMRVTLSIEKELNSCFRRLRLQQEQMHIVTRPQMRMGRILTFWLDAKNRAVVTFHSALRPIVRCALDCRTSIAMLGTFGPRLARLSKRLANLLAFRNWSTRIVCKKVSQKVR